MTPLPRLKLPGINSSNYWYPSNRARVRVGKSGNIRILRTKSALRMKVSSCQHEVSLKCIPVITTFIILAPDTQQILIPSASPCLNTNGSFIRLE
jgi:hypothetical protein